MNKEQRAYFCKRVTNICSAQCSELERVKNAEKATVPDKQTLLFKSIEEGDEAKIAKQLLKEAKEFLKSGGHWYNFLLLPSDAESGWSLGFSATEAYDKLRQDIQDKYDAKRIKLENTANRLKDMAMFGGDAVKLDALLNKFAAGKLTDKDIANCKVFESVEG